MFWRCPYILYPPLPYLPSVSPSPLPTPSSGDRPRFPGAVRRGDAAEEEEEEGRAGAPCLPQEVDCRKVHVYPQNIHNLLVV